MHKVEGPSRERFLQDVDFHNLYLIWQLVEEASVSVDSDDTTAASNSLRHGRGDAAGASAKLQDMYARPQARPLAPRQCRLVEQLSERIEAVSLAVPTLVQAVHSVSPV